MRRSFDLAAPAMQSHVVRDLSCDITPVNSRTLYITYATLVRLRMITPNPPPAELLISRHSLTTIPFIYAVASAQLDSRISLCTLLCQLVVHQLVCTVIPLTPALYSIEGSRFLHRSRVSLFHPNIYVCYVKSRSRYITLPFRASVPSTSTSYDPS